MRCGTLLVSAALVATLLGPLLGSLILIAVGIALYLLLVYQLHGDLFGANVLLR